MLVFLDDFQVNVGIKALRVSKFICLPVIIIKIINLLVVLLKKNITISKTLPKDYLVGISDL